MAWTPDDKGINGVYLGKDIVSHAGRALRMCMEDVTPRLLTWGQTASAGLHMLKKALLGAEAAGEWVPDYTTCMNHFAIHAGGYAVLQGIREGLKLPADKVRGPADGCMRACGARLDRRWCLYHVPMPALHAHASNVPVLEAAVACHAWRPLHRCCPHLPRCASTETPLAPQRCG
jgi:hypothetical protein